MLTQAQLLNTSLDPEDSSRQLRANRGKWSNHNSEDDDNIPVRMRFMKWAFENMRHYTTNGEFEERLNNWT